MKKQVISSNTNAQWFKKCTCWTKRI